MTERRIIDVIVRTAAIDDALAMDVVAALRNDGWELLRRTTEGDERSQPAWFAQTIIETRDRAYACGREEAQEQLLNLLGYDKNGDGLTRQETRDSETVTICNDPYYDLEGALIDLERQGADKVCIDTIRRVQKRLGDVARFVRGESDRWQ